MGVDIKYSADDPQLDRVFSSLSVDEMKIEVDGENMHISSETNLGKNGVKIDYILISEMIYAKATVTSNGSKTTVKKKTSVNDQERAEIIGDVGISVENDYEYFSDVSMKKLGDTFVITCTEANEDFYETINESIKEATKASGGSASVRDAKMVIKISDKKFVSAKMTANIEITVDDEICTIAMEIGINYDYDSTFEIKKPSDAKDYEKVRVDEIVEA